MALGKSLETKMEGLLKNIYKWVSVPNVGRVTRYRSTAFFGVGSSREKIKNRGLMGEFSHL